MSSLEQSEETRALEAIVPSLEAEGYSVYVKPSKSLLPPIIGEIKPDAIALGSPKNLVIEFIQEGSSYTKRLDRLRDRLAGHPDWELRVYYLRPATAGRPIDPVSMAAVETALRSVESLSSSGQLPPALLTGWATLEAAARALLPARFGRPQTADRLVEVLALEGHVTPSEADVLRRLADLRNRFSHGALHVSVDPQDLQKFIEILRTLAASVPANAA